MAGKTKYKNIPSYMNNAKSSFKQIMTNEISNIMPGLSSTTVSVKEALSKVKILDRSHAKNINRYVRNNRRYILGTVSDFIKNAKEDLSTGNFYNQERADKRFSNGIDSMLGNFDDSDGDTTYFDDVEMGNKNSQFDKYLKSTSAGSSRNTEIIAETNINTTDYLANVNTMNNTKLITVGIKQHMEQMKSLNNIEKITGGILKFNQDVLAESLENRDRYLESILDETKELKSMIQIQMANNMARYKGSSGGSSKDTSHIDKILNSGGTIDIKEYAKIVKKNLSNTSPIPLEFLKNIVGDVVDNPISTILGYGFNAMLGKDLKNTMRKFDKTLSGAFASYILKMQKVKNNGNNMIGRLLGEILGVDINKQNKPSLGGYKYKDMSLEIEQMKAKSITEVIPTYLSEITKSLTGIDKVYDYNKGIFVDKSKQRKEYDKELKNYILGDMFSTQDNMRQGLYSIKSLNKTQAKLLEADLDDFLYFIGLIPEAYNDNMSYSYMTKLGLKLRGGEKSYKIIKEIYKNMPSDYKNTARLEHLQSLGNRSDMWNTFNNNLQSSGASAVYNQFNNPSFSGKRVFKRGGRTYTVTDDDLHIDVRELDKLDIVQIKDALSKGFITKEEARKASNNVNNRTQEDKKSASEQVFDELRYKASNAKNKFNIKNPIRNITDKFNTYINGLDAAVTGMFYTDSDDSRNLYARIKDFGKDIYKANKNLLFGDNGFINDKYAANIKKYGKGAIAGGGVGASIGQIIGKPIIGSVLGAVTGMVAETEKVKTFLWGNGVDKDGLLGGLASTINKHIMNPLKDWFRRTFGEKANKLFDSVKDSFSKNFGKAKEKVNTTGEKVFGNIENIFSTNNDIKGRSYSTMDDTVVELVQDMERGIYSNQLDMIIYLLSNGNLRGRGVKVGGKSPKPGSNNPNDRNVPGLDRRRYKMAGYDIPAETVERNIPGLNRRHYKRVNKINSQYPYQVPSPYIIGSTGGTQSDYGNLFNDVFRENTDNWIKFNNRQTINNELAIVTPGDIVVHSAESYLIRDKEYAKYVKNMAQKAKEAARDSGNNINSKFKEKSSSGKDDQPFTLENVINKAKGPAKKWYNNTLLKRGIGKGQGSLIGMALGTILLGNPLLGAVAGATFAGRNEKQKEINASLPKQAIFGTSMKYGAIAALLGINPMYGILLGSLFPQSKDKKDRKPLKLFGKEIKMNNMMKGALAGGLFGPYGALVGGLIGRGMDKRSHRNDWKYNEDGTKKTSQEIKEYREEQKRKKAEKDAKGKLFDKFTGGGKLRGIATGALGGLLGFGPIGLLGGGILGGIGSTSQNKLNRNNTQGILSKMGMNKWQSAVIGSIIANTLLLGPLGALGAGALAPIIGGSLGLLLSKGKDKRFWKYDENGKLLSKNDQRRSYQRFKHDVMYDENGERRSVSDSVKYARNRVKEENKYRDDIAKKNGEEDKKKLDTKQIAENVKKLEFLEIGKGTGTFKGAQYAAAAGVNPLVGAGIGFLISKKKRTPPKGFSDDPIYVRIKGNDPKSEEGRTEIKEKIKEKILGKANERKSLIQSRNLMSSFKTDTNALLKSGTNSAQGLILKDINGSTTPDKIDSLYKRATFLSSFKNAGGIANVIGGEVGETKEKSSGILGKLMDFFKTKGGQTIAKIAAMLAGGMTIKEILKNAFRVFKNNVSDSLTLAQGGDAVKNFYEGSVNMENENYNSASGNYSKGGYRATQFGVGLTSKIMRGIGLGRANYLTKTATTGADIAKYAGAAANYSEKAGFIANKVSKITEKIWKILDAIAKKFPSMAEAINKHKSKIASKVATETLEQGAKKGLLHTLEKVTVVLTIAQAIYDFSTGMYETNNLIGVTADYTPTTTARICSGLAKAISGFLVIVPKQFVFNIIYSIINKEEYQNIKNSRSQSEANYKEFVNANPGTELTYDQYKKITNPTAWSKMTSWITGKDKTLDRYVTNRSYDIPDYIKNNNTKDQNIASTYNTKDEKTKKKDALNFNILQSTPLAAIGTTFAGGGLLGLPMLLSWIDKKIFDSKNKNSDQSNSGAGYVIQDNSVTYNVNSPTSYDTSNTGGGRGPASSGYMYLKNKVRNNIVTTSTENKSPVQTFLKVADKDNMSYMLNSAVNNGAVFLDDIKNNKKITNAAKDSNNLSAKKNGYNIITNMASNIANKSKKFGTKLWEGAKSVGSSLISGAKNISSKIISGVRNVGSRAIDNVKNIFSGGRGEDPDYYNQQDSRWANMNFGIYDNKRDTVGEGGCGPTTAATVIQKLTGRKVTPAETSKFALQRGYKLDNGGTTPDYFRDIGAQYGVNMSQDSATSNNTINNLRQGKPVIFLGHDKTGTSPFGNDSHYVIGTKMDNKGNVQVLDPKNRENNHTYNITDLAMNATDAIVASGGRGKPVYKNRSRSYSRSSKFDKNQFILPGRGVNDVNIIESNFTWNSPLSKRSSTDYIVLHHAEAKTCSVQQIDSWHKSNGWAGIGYHFLVRKDGSIYRGRPLWSIGAHVQGKNSNSVGICAEGDFMKESMSDVQKNAIAKLINYLKIMYPNAKVVGHKDIGDSNCPGNNYPLNELKNYTKLLSKNDTKTKPKKSLFNIKKAKKTLFGGRGSGFNIIETNLDWSGSLEERSSTDYIALHHAEAKKCTVEDIHSWHKERGWVGIGYHFFVRKDGSIYRGRPIDSLGAHVQGKNDCSIGICAEGDFMNETMSSAQKHAIAKLIYYLKTAYYPNATVVGHKEIGDSNCPGTNYPLSELKNYTKLLSKEEMAAIDKMPKSTGKSGKSSRNNWMTVAKQVKEAIAAKKPSYGNSVSITVNGKTFNVRCDCSGYVSACLYACGARKSSEPTYTGDMVQENGSMKETGFTYKKWSGWDSLNPGDIIVRDSKGSAHTEIFVRNDCGKHYVYNCGSTNSVQSPGETVSAGGDYEVVWQPSGEFTGSSSGSSDGSSGSSGKKNMLNIMSDWFDKMTDSVNNPLKNVKKVINKSYITPKETITPLVQDNYSDGTKGIIHREIPALANANKNNTTNTSSSNNNNENSKDFKASNGLFNKRIGGGRGTSLMGFDDVQNKGGMFGFTSYLNTITESIDGSANSSSNNESSNNSSGDSSTGSFSGDLSGSVNSDDLGKKVTVDQALNRNAKSFSKITAQQLKDAIDKGACKKGSWLSTQVDGIMKAAKATGIDPRFIAAKAAGEIGWDGSKISRDKHNMFGINATDNNPYGNAYTYANDEEGWVEGAKWFAKNYIDAGQNSFYKMKNPTAAGQPAWHSYQTGDITPKAQIYANMINATGGAGISGGRGSSTDKLYNKYASKTRKRHGRGTSLMGFDDVQNKGGMFGFTSYLNTITESIDGSSASTSTDESGSTSSSSSGGSPSNGKGAMGSGDTYRNSTFGPTSRCGTISVPSGLGTVYTYEQWQGIKYYNAGKLKTESGMNFDSEGFGKIGDRFVVAMTSTFGVDGDYVNIKLTNGQTLYAVIGDEKDQTTAHGADCANKWGHNNGKNIIEFIVDGGSWYSNGGGSHSNVGQEGFHPEMANVGVVSVENIGGYWGKSSGGRGSSKISSKLSSLIPSRKHNNSTRKANVNIPKLTSPIRYSTSNSGMAPIPSTRSVSSAIADKNYKSTINDIDQLDTFIRSNISTNADTNNITENQTELAMLEVLKSIASTLERIEKNASMNNQNNVYAVPYGNNQMRYNPNTYKNDMMRSIVTGR